MTPRRKMSFQRIIRLRMILIALFAVFLFGSLVWRMVYISMAVPELREYVKNENSTRVDQVIPKRGQILDRNGLILAESIDAYALYVNPRALKDPEMFAAAVGSIIEVPEKEIVEKIKKNSQELFLTIKRKLTASQYQDILNIRKPHYFDFGFEPDQRREYPKNKSAASVIGFVGWDNYGLSGIEFSCNHYLQGIPGKKIEYQTFMDDRVPLSSDILQKPVPGYNLVTCLDYTLQNLVEGILEKHIHQWDARGGVAIVIQPKTGEILCMANQPSFDLNQGGEFIQQPEYSNKAVSMNFEPGSIFKPIVASAALEEGIITPMSLHQCNGRINIADKTIECMLSHGEQNLSDIIRNSCNVSFVGIGMKLREQMYRFALRFNFGSQLPLELYQEKGVIPSPSSWYETTIATFSFGQGISATPLQMAMAYAAIANDGMMMKPQIIHEIKDAAGNIIQAFEPKLIRKVISSDTAREIKVALKNSVQDPRGTQAANIPGLSVGGKTGTAKKVVDGRYVDEKVITSFVGFFPVEDPQYVVLVSIDEPKPSYEAYGATVAAPIFREIVQWMQSHMLINP